MTTSLPSGVRPNSYLVSTRMSPRSAQISWPAAKSFIAIAAASSKSAAVTWPVARISSRDPETSCSPLGALVVGVRMGLGQRLVLLEPVGQDVPAEVPHAALVVGPEARRRRARRVRAHDHLDQDRLALDALEDVGVRGAERVVGRDAFVWSNHHAARRFRTCPLNGTVPRTRSNALMRSVTTM